MPVQQADPQTRSAMNLGRLIEQFGTDDRARDYLLHLRWPDGIRCPQCGFDKVSRIGWTDKPSGKKGRRQFDCNSCRSRFSVTSGTVFHDSHLPLWKWFAATYLMCGSKKGVSANQLMRMLGIGSYKTAWYLCHRIRSAMQQVAPDLLEGTVEVDETYVGGKSSGVGRGKGKGFDRKVMVLGALERDGEVRLRVEKRKRGNADILQGWIRAQVDEDAAVSTDTHPGYRSLTDFHHEMVDHSAEEWVRGDVGTQGIESPWSLLKRSIVGSYHQLSEKHLQSYMDEFAFRFNNRENPYLFRDTLLALLSAEALTYDRLVSG